MVGASMVRGLTSRIRKRRQGEGSQVWLCRRSRKSRRLSSCAARKRTTAGRYRLPSCTLRHASRRLPKLTISGQICFARFAMLFPGAGAALTRRLLAAPVRFVFLRFSCPERNAIPKSRAVRPSIKRRLRARVARRQPIFVLALDAALYRLQAKRPARTPTDQSAPRSGLRPKHGGRGRARPQATGRPGPVRVSPVLLPGAECKPQVARCPALREETASGANCEAATDIRIGVGRRVIQIAGEKARTNAIHPRRAEVRLASQIWGPGPRSPAGYWPPRPGLCFSGSFARSGAQIPSRALSGSP